MSTSLCKTSVVRVYQEIIDDVISGVRELFIEDGVDEQVLQELKQTWETKLMASKAVQNEQEEKVKRQNEIIATNGFPKQQVVNQQVVNQPQQVVTQQQVINQGVPQGTQLQPQQITQVVGPKMVPIQITLPPPAGSDTQRVLTIQVPDTALTGNQLQKVLTGPVITATMSLPPNIASSLLQQHVNAALNSQPQPLTIVNNKPVIQTDGPNDSESDGEEIEIEFILPSTATAAKSCGSSKKSKAKRNCVLNTASSVNTSNDKTVFQLDGPIDSSDDDEDGSDDNDDDDDIDDDKDEDDQEMEDEGGEEEPLNSEDDVTDDDPTDLFDTENIVVCQYDKIIRNRNKWKFYLKDGMMNLNGQDYVFQKANGDAEW